MPYCMYHSRTYSYTFSYTFSAKSNLGGQVILKDERSDRGGPKRTYFRFPGIKPLYVPGTLARRNEDRSLSQLSVFQIPCCLDFGSTLGAQGLFKDLFQFWEYKVLSVQNDRCSIFKHE